VGSGPFPTELYDAVGEELQEKGHEFGATTGRPRRCGWVDLPALKYAIMVNGVTHLNMMKADVLSGFDHIKVCTHYDTPEGQVDHLPFELNDKITPVYKDLEGWSEDLTSMSDSANLPAALESYIEYLEAELEVPISIVSVGPDRTQTISRNGVLA
jgi:adenylosuccinate synthase